MAGAEPLFLDEDLGVRRELRGGLADLVGAVADHQRQIARRRPRLAAAATCATIGRPAISCSTFGLALFMRVPSPAARMIDRQLLWLMMISGIGRREDLQQF